MYRLVFLNNKFKGKRVAVKQGSVLIGRSPECHLDLDDDDEVSRQHAVIETRPDGVHIRDQGSLNKVQVNGRRVEESRLSHGDQVEVGRTRFEFQLVDEQVATSRRRVGALQAITLAAIALVLTLEVLFLVRMLLWHSSDLGASLSITALPQTPVTTVEESIRQAEKHAPKPKPPPPPKPAEPEAIPPERSATIPPAPPTGQMEHEVKQLREEMETLRQQIEGLAEPPPAPAAPAPEPAPAPAQPPPAPKPSPAPEDTVALVAQDMLKAALKEIAANNLRGADQQLERIQIMAPDFIPAYAERARVQERLGNLKKAGEQWGEVLKRAVGTPLYSEAAAERIRLARAEMTVSNLRSTSRTSHPYGALPGTIKIQSVEAEKFQSSEEFDEMRLLRITLNPKIPDREVDSDRVRIEVIFFDRDQATDQIGPTRVRVPEDNWQVEGEWPSRERKTVTAAYIVPKGFRMDEEDDYQQTRSYYGYVVKVYYRDELQDVNARPKDLLVMAEQLDSAQVQSIVPSD